MSTPPPQPITTGALSRPIDILTFAGYFQTVRLFGGELGVAFMQHFLSAREQFHSNILGLSVQLGESATTHRLLGLSAGMLSRSPGLGAASGRAGEILSLQVKQQAFTLANTDSFLLVAWSIVCCLIVIAGMAPVPIQYRHVTQVTDAPA
jgi:DHA2 family multidrug resistance protein